MTMDTLELEQELPRRERRKLVTPTAAVAAAVAIAALGFAGGVQVQKSSGSEAPAGRQPGAFPGGGQQQRQQASDATVGEVSGVDGSTIYVDDASGNTIRVKIAKGGVLTRTAVEDADEIHPGDTVVVQGETRESGTVVASSIRATASNAGSFTAPPGGG